MSFNITVEGGTSVRLPTSGKYCDRDIIVTAEGGGTTPAEPIIEPLAITENGTYTAPGGVDGYSPVTVNVPIPDGYIVPSGTKTITENGTHDVTEYASVDVSVAGSGGDDEWFNDGNTHIWITLHEGRTSPMLGVCSNGTVTVDWGDGTTPDTLNGTSTNTTAWTPNHEYEKAGDYVITLTVNGELSFRGDNGEMLGSCVLRYSANSDYRNIVYKSAVQKIELGNGIEQVTQNAFNGLSSLQLAVLPQGIKFIGDSAFLNCRSLKSIRIPNSVTWIGDNSFQNCYALKSVEIPDSVTNIRGSAFSSCYLLESITIPNGVTRIGDYAFSNCCSITSVDIPNGVTDIGNYQFESCYSVIYYDFSKHTTVPTLKNGTAFKNIVPDCEIRVPAVLYDEWIAATNWATYASYIKAV